jgi:riboflavin synthase
MAAMFTGIIRHVGRVLAAAPSPAGRRLEIDLGPLAAGLAVGDSVAVSGVCLTATAAAGSSASFDVVAETLSRSTLGELRIGDRVNLERSLRAGDALDGHIVQGHVDGVAELAAIRRGGQCVLEFACDAALADQMVTKGSVALAGVSLTLVDVSASRFSVAVIPTTLELTTLGGLRTGQRVNVETDVIGKYVRKYLRQLGGGSGGGLTMGKLRDAGFI